MLLTGRVYNILGKEMKKKLYALVTIVFLGLSGCSNDKDLSKEEAKEKALQEVSGKVTGYNQDLKDSPPYYEFDIVQEGQRYEIKVHSKTGEIISKELDASYQETKLPQTDTHSNPNSTNETASMISMEDAKNIALERVGGGTIIKCELDNDDDYTPTIQVYEVEIHYNNKEYDVTIDAISKEVIQVKEDRID